MRWGPSGGWSLLLGGRGPRPPTTAGPGRPHRLRSAGVADLLALTVADPPAVWQDLGFAVEGGEGPTDDALAWVGGVALRLGAEGRGVTAWSLAGVGLPGTDDLEGLALAGGFPLAGTAREHPNGVVAIDHLVVSTPDVERTVATFGSLGLELRRRREGEAYGQQMHQAFFWLGDVILEVVGPPVPKGDGPASFFGLAFSVADLDATAAYLGDRLSAPKEATQPGRHIATLRSAAGSSVAMAFMSPHPK